MSASHLESKERMQPGMLSVISIFDRQTHSVLRDRQGTLDGVITQEARPPTFTSEGLLDYIIQLIVSEDEANF